MESLAFTWPEHTALLWTPICICIIVVALRVAVRLHLEVLGVDDVLMIHAVALFVIVGSLTEASISNTSDEVPALLSSNLEYAFSELSQLLVLLFGKASIGFQLIRIFGGTSKWWSRFILALLWLLALITLMDLPMAILPLCDPNDPDSISPGCANEAVEVGFASLFNVYHAFTDIVFSVIPITFIYKLQVSKGKKLALSVILGLGWTAGAFALTREITGDKNLANSEEISQVVSQLERTLVIICGSLGAIAPMFKQWNVLRPWTSLATVPGKFSVRHASSGSRSWFGMRRNADDTSFLHTSSTRPLHDPEKGQTTTNITAGATVRQSSDTSVPPTNRMNIGIAEDAPWRV